MLYLYFLFLGTFFLVFISFTNLNSTKLEYQYRWGVILKQKGMYLGTSIQEIQQEEQAFLKNLEIHHVFYKLEETMHDLMHFVSLSTCNKLDLGIIAIVDQVLHVFSDEPTPVLANPVTVEKNREQPNVPLVKRNVEPDPTMFTDPSYSQYFIHELTGVNELHQKGITGKGIKIGILDSGIDAHHPAFECISSSSTATTTSFSSCRIKKYRDYVKPKQEVPPKFLAHGTKVAGIIIGKQKHRFVGVAPEADIYIYRIFNAHGELTFFRYSKAIEDAIFKDRIDVINMSFGVPDPWNKSNLTSIMDDVVRPFKKAIVSVAGNRKGLFLTVSPGNSKDVISVASLDTPSFLNKTLIVNNVSLEYLDSDKYPLEQKAIATELVVLDPFLHTTLLCDSEEAFSQYRVRRSTIILYQGKCYASSVYNMIRNAAFLGVSSILVAVSDSIFHHEYLRQLDVQKIKNWARIKESDSIKVFKRMPGVYKHFKIQFKQLKAEPLNYHGLTLSSFSAFGPTADYHMKPDISAFGRNVYVPIPIEEGTWGLEDGTSLAAPYVTGCIALLMQAKGELDLDVLRSLLMTSAKPLESLESNWALPVYGQGAGMIQVNRAFQQTTILRPLEGLTLKHGYQVWRSELDIENQSNLPLLYTLSHFPALSIQGLNTYVNISLNLTWVPSVILVQPGRHRKIQLVFECLSTQAPLGTLFSGYIILQPTTITTIDPSSSSSSSSSSSPPSFSTNLPPLHYPYTAIQGSLNFDEMHSEVVKYAFHLHGQPSQPIPASFNDPLTFPLSISGNALTIQITISRPLRLISITLYKLDSLSQFQPRTYWIGNLFRREYVFPGTYDINLDQHTFSHKHGEKGSKRGHASKPLLGYYQLVTVGHFQDPINLENHEEDGNDRIPKNGIRGQILDLT